MQRYQEPEYLPWDGRRVPLTFLAGYLGAGKTTLVNRVLASATAPVAVLVNDVGEVNIDSRLIRRQDGKTIELTDGCVCCSISDGFGAAFDQLRARPNPPDHVVVELSGVAEPARVLPWGKSAGFKLDGAVTVVAADQIAELVGEPIIELTVMKQLASADLIALTKVDLLSGRERQAARQLVVRLLHKAWDEGLAGSEGDPLAIPIVDASEPSLATSLLHLGGRTVGDLDDLPAPTLFDSHVTELVPMPDPIERAQLDALLESLAGSQGRVVRAKGIARDADDRRWSVQVVGRRVSVTELLDAESEDPTDLVVIRVTTGAS